MHAWQQPSLAVTESLSPKTNMLTYMRTCLQSVMPLAVVGGLHFAQITDLSWSHDGRLLAVASR